MKKIVSLIWLTVCVSTLAIGQQKLGMAGSNYAGTHSIYMNPSSIANSRLGFYMDVASLQAGASNNYIKLPLGLGSTDADWNSSDFIKKETNRAKSAYVQGQVNAFSFMVKLSPVHSVALTNRIRYGMSFTNVSPQLATIIVEGADEKDFIGKTYQNITFNTNVNAYAETGLTYARVIKSNDNFMIKGGLTINRLHGITSAYANSKDLSFSMAEEPNPQMPIENQTILDIQRVDLRYGYVDGSDAFDNISTKTFLGKGTPGKGWGFNLGATFEKQEKNTFDKAQTKMIDSLGSVYKGKKSSSEKMHNTYKYRLGVSLMDIGGIRYSGNTIKSYDISRTNRQIVADSLDGAPEEIGEVINWALGIKDSEKKTSFTSGLPTAFHVNFDYHLKGKVYVNALWVQNLRGKNAIGLRQPSMFSVTPRIEMRWFEVAIPVGMVNNYSNFTLGTYLKLGIFDIGSDNIAGALGLGKTYGADVYAGVHIPVFAKQKAAK